MGQPSRRRTRALAATAALSALGYLAPQATAADLTVEGPPPSEVINSFRDCPSIDLFTMKPEYCIKFTVYDGELKLGKTVARVDDRMVITVGVGLGSDSEGNLAAEIVTGPGEGDPDPIKIAGGILGIPELDPILDSTLGLLSVSASPQLGSPSIGVAPGQDPFAASLAFLEWLSGTNAADVAINLPLSIDLNNLLLGNRCSIDQFEVNLTTGTTAPPVGTPAMTGSHGEFSHTYFATNWPSTSGGDNLHSRVGARLVDNTFTVPGASQCDLLVGDLLNQPVGLLDRVVSGQAGLPSGAGSNYAAFSVDTDLISYSMIGRTSATPTGQVNFGSVPVGAVSDIQTMTVVGEGPLQAVRLGQVGLAGGSGVDHFEIVNDSCSGQSLSVGDECTIDLRFAPTSNGTKTAMLRITDNSSGPIPTLQLRGAGVNP